MSVRPTMLPLIGRVRQLIFDPQSTNFQDQEIQDVLDESRVDVLPVDPLSRLEPKLTYAPAIQYLNYYSQLGGWEEDYTFQQNLTHTVTPSYLEPIAGHFQFATSTYPPVYITGKIYDVHRASADLLERLAARYVLQFSFSSDGQSFHPEQIQANIAGLVKQYRAKQRPRTITMSRSDLSGRGNASPLAPTLVDYVSTGDN